MKRTARAAAAALSLFGLVGGCGAGMQEPGGPASAGGSSVALGPPLAPVPSQRTEPPAPSHQVVKDDLPGALALAKAAGKLVFVDAWATWCHTCMSMKNYVLKDPSLTSYQERMVFVELDTDRDENAAFQEKYAVEMLPSFFVLDSTGAVLGMWPGSASVGELREFLDGSIEAHEALSQSGLSADNPLKALVEARGLHAQSKHREAAKAYGTAMRKAPADWPRRSEALKGWLGSLARAGLASECVKVGLEHLEEVRGASIPADFSNQLLACAEALKNPLSLREVATKVEARLTQILEDPPPVMAPDDVADGWNILSYARSLRQDRAGARAAVKRGLEALERAAAAAKEPEVQATFDYGRAKAYLELGRTQDALKMLEEREKQIPTSAEAPARLSQVYAKLGRGKDAVKALERAVKLANGPRKLMYLERKSGYELALGDAAAAVATLEAEVAGWAALTGKRARPKQLEAAKARLAKAKARLGR